MNPNRSAALNIAQLVPPQTPQQSKEYQQTQLPDPPDFEAPMIEDTSTEYDEMPTSERSPHFDDLSFTNRAPHSAAVIPSQYHFQAGCTSHGTISGITDRTYYSSDAYTSGAISITSEFASHPPNFLSNTWNNPTSDISTGNTADSSVNQRLDYGLLPFYHSSSQDPHDPYSQQDQ